MMVSGGRNMTNVMISGSNNSLFVLKNAQATESVTREVRVFWFRVGEGAERWPLTSPGSSALVSVSGTPEGAGGCAGGLEAGMGELRTPGHL